MQLSFAKPWDAAAMMMYFEKKQAVALAMGVANGACLILGVASALGAEGHDALISPNRITG